MRDRMDSHMTANEDLIAAHPWLAVTAATTAGVLLGGAVERLPDDTRERVSSVARRLLRGAAFAALRHGLGVGASKLIGWIQPSTPQNQERDMEPERDTGMTSTGDVKHRLREAAARTGEAIDSATSSIGRGMQRATAGVTRAGEYLEEASPKQMGMDITDVIRRHPKASIAVGVGLGFLISRLLSR